MLRLLGNNNCNHYYSTIHTLTSQYLPNFPSNEERGKWREWKEELVRIYLFRQLFCGSNIPKTWSHLWLCRRDPFFLWRGVYLSKYLQPHRRHEKGERRDTSVLEQMVSFLSTRGRASVAFLCNRERHCLSRISARCSFVGPSVPPCLLYICTV